MNSPRRGTLRRRGFALCRKLSEQTGARVPRPAHNTLGVICKTQARAERLHDSLRSNGIDAHLLTAESASFVRGITVCTAHMAKGLEFDQVVVPEVSGQNYYTTMDNSQSAFLGERLSSGRTRDRRRLCHLRHEF